MEHLIYGIYFIIIMNIIYSIHVYKTKTKYEDLLGHYHEFNSLIKNLSKVNLCEVMKGVTFKTCDKTRNIYDTILFVNETCDSIRETHYINPRPLRLEERPALSWLRCDDIDTKEYVDLLIMETMGLKKCITLHKGSNNIMGAIEVLKAVENIILSLEYEMLKEINRGG